MKLSAWLWGFLWLGLAVMPAFIANRAAERAYAMVYRTAEQRLADLALIRDVEGLSIRLEGELQAWRGSGEVPSILAATIPPGVEEADAPDAWKRRFLATTAPLILKVNALITADRARLERLATAMRQGRAPNRAQKAWLARLWQAYGVDEGDFTTLLERLDVVPPSLALAQAAVESAWGRSRFAAQGNALFGQWTWRGRGLVPTARAAGARHRVRAFPDLLRSVYAYIHNLNTHAAYAAFRAERQRQRLAGAGWDSPALADTLLNYSALGEAYPRKLRAVMRVNRLADFDSAALAD
ncbi:MAG: glucosaminidase domain-containing protein [Pseudomonadota bacterium]